MCRSHINTISKLEDTNGVMVEDLVELRCVANEYFLDMFTAQEGVYLSVVSTHSRCISADDNEMLLSSFQREEFTYALRQMHPDKAPGPDGFNPSFFKYIWPDYGDEIYNASCSWLDRGFSLIL